MDTWTTSGERLGKQVQVSRYTTKALDAPGYDCIKYVGESGETTRIRKSRADMPLAAS